MDIVRSLELESCILTKLTKPSVPVNLVGPQVSLPLYWVPANRGSILFLCVIRRNFLACEDIAGGSQQSGGESFFCPNALPGVRRCRWWVPAVRGANHFFSDALPCVRRYSWWVPAVRGKRFFREIRWPVWWVPAVRWRNNYFARNKEALPCGCRGPSC